MRLTALPIVTLIVSLLGALPATAVAQSRDSATAAVSCSQCAAWNKPQAPFRIFGNTYYVGTDGLSAILVTSPQGHVLIDGALTMSAPQIVANIRALGFLVEDVRLIVNSHAHYDHAGGIAELQRASGATVAAHPWSAAVMRKGRSVAGDPQLGLDIPYPPVTTVRELKDGETLRAGSVDVTAHFTGGHTPGGTTWTWKSCEGSRCLDMVYADSQTPVSTDSFLFTKNDTYPNAVQDFERAFATIEGLRCDILLTPHPSASGIFERQAARALEKPGACKAYAATARNALAKRIATEQAKR